jgi:hypothetical protein
MDNDLNFSKLEEVLNFFNNGRRPQFFRKWKTILTFWQRENYYNIEMSPSSERALGENGTFK